MTWHLNVPKILHVYWSATPMPYLRYATVTSFMAQNPDWEVMLWLPKYKYKVVTWQTSELQYTLSGFVDYYPELLKLPITINYLDLEDFGESNEMSEVHKSDYLRYWMLYKYGGVYSDMDILYFANIDKLKVNTEENKDKETFVCISPHYGHSAGFYMAAKGCRFFKKMYESVKIDPTIYQSVGPDAMNEAYPTLESINEITPAAEIGMEAVYAYDGRRIIDIYISRKKIPSKFTEYSIGIHWYGGHPMTARFLTNTHGGVNRIPNNVLGRLLK